MTFALYSRPERFLIEQLTHFKKYNIPEGNVRSWCTRLDMHEGLRVATRRCDAAELLSLKRLRDLAAKKRVSGLKQKNILDLFS